MTFLFDLAIFLFKINVSLGTFVPAQSSLRPANESNPQLVSKNFEKKLIVKSL